MLELTKLLIGHHALASNTCFYNKTRLACLNQNSPCTKRNEKKKLIFELKIEVNLQMLTIIQKSLYELSSYFIV